MEERIFIIANRETPCHFPKVHPSVMTHKTYNKSLPYILELKEIASCLKALIATHEAETPRHSTYHRAEDRWWKEAG